MGAVDTLNVTKNFIRLLDITDLETLLPKIRHFKVLSDEDLSKIENDELHEKHRKRLLILACQVHGKDALDKLATCYDKVDNHEAVRIIKPSGSSVAINHTQSASIPRKRTCVEPSNQTTTMFALAPGQQDTERLRLAGQNARENENILLTDQRLIVKVIPATQFCDIENDSGIDTYGMRRKTRGAVLIINNIEFGGRKYCGETLDRRDGAEVDHKNLLDLFTQLNFVIRDYKNLDYNDLCDKVLNFVGDKEMLHDVDCCFVILMSHGSIDGKGAYIFSTNAVPVYVNDVIINKFNNPNCPELAGKPKVFVLQHCQGRQEDYGVVVAGDRDAATLSAQMDSQLSVDDDSNVKTGIQSDGMPTTMTLRSNTDMMTVEATLPGFASFRDPATGSWLIQTMCRVFMNHAHRLSVSELFDLVDLDIQNLRTEHHCAQTTKVSKTAFNRRMFLNPGIYQNERMELCKY